MMKLDDIDKQILSNLQEDGRMTYAAIAQHVGLTSTAVGHRVQKMLDEGIIRSFGVDLDREKLGLAIQALISLKLNFARLDDFQKILKSINEIEFCYRVTGEDCMIMKVNLQDNAHLLQFINKISAYGFTKSSIVMERMV
jgi:Lrp/AsnC family leucine-responsive transcriptional regulator